MSISKRIFTKKKKIINGWIHIDSISSAKIVAKAGFDAITIDLQHGMFSFEKCRDIIQGIEKYKVFPIVRVPSNDIGIINKVLEGRPHIVDAILNKEIDMIINTTEGRQSIKDSFSIRRSALEHNIFFTTTISGGFAIVESLEKGVENWEYKPLQLS